MIDVTLRDLKATKQGFNETFSEYMMRWKNKVSRMVNRPNEKDQINMIIKNMLPAYNKRLLSSPINYFVDLCDCGTRIEDVINSRQMDLSEAKFQAKKVFNEGEKGGALNNVNVIFTRLQKRVFDDLYAFHQRIGHKTNCCLRLKHEVQDLIHQGMITKA